MPACELLGDDHPLARATRELRTFTIQLASTAAFIAVMALGAFARGQSTRAIVIAAVIVAPMLLLRVVSAVDDRRARARDAIVAGLEDIPARELRAARRHYASRRCRHHLLVGKLVRTRACDAGAARSPRRAVAGLDAMGCEPWV